jgi:hypothetical protein
MDWLGDAIIIAGLTSLALLWIGSVAGMLHVAWNTVGKPLKNALERIKRR